MSEEETANTVILEKAKRLGYDPDRYTKDDPKWKSPEEFLEFGERLNPILRENNKRLEEKNAILEARVTDIQAKVLEFAKLHEKTKKEAYAQALADLKTQKREALETGDYDRVVEVDELIAETKEAAKEKEVSAVKPQPKANEPSPEAQRIFNEWGKENTWAIEGSDNYDLDMEIYARSVGEATIKRSGMAPTMDNFRAHLDNIARKVKERFPEKFEKSPREMGSMVESGAGSGAGGGSIKHTYANLPKEAKEACDFLVETGTFKSRADYIAKYYADKQ